MNSRKFDPGDAIYRRGDEAASAYEVRAGDFACFSDGQVDDATVHETIVKCSMYHATKPLPFEVTPPA